MLLSNEFEWLTVKTQKRIVDRVMMKGQRWVGDQMGKKGRRKRRHLCCVGEMKLKRKQTQSLRWVCGSCLSVVEITNGWCVASSLWATLVKCLVPPRFVHSHHLMTLATTIPYSLSIMVFYLHYHSPPCALTVLLIYFHLFSWLAPVEHTHSLLVPLIINTLDHFRLSSTLFPTYFKCGFTHASIFRDLFC